MFQIKHPKVQSGIPQSTAPFTNNRTDATKNRGKANGSGLFIYTFRKGILVVEPPAGGCPQFVYEGE